MQLARESSNWTKRHWLIRRVQIQSAGAIVQRSSKTNPMVHRLNRRQRSSIRRLNGHNCSRRTLTGWTDACEQLKHRCNWRTAENPNERKTYSPVEPTYMSTSVGLTGVRKNTVQRRFSSPWSLKNLTIDGPNHIQSSPNFVGTITKDLWTCPREESTNYSMVWEESTKFEVRLGFSQECKNFDSWWLVIPGILALG